MSIPSVAPVNVSDERSSTIFNYFLSVKKFMKSVFERIMFTSRVVFRNELIALGENYRDSIFKNTALSLLLPNDNRITARLYHFFWPSLLHCTLKIEDSLAFKTKNGSIIRQSGFFILNAYIRSAFNRRVDSHDRTSRDHWRNTEYHNNYILVKKRIYR